MAQTPLKLPFDQYRRVQTETGSGADLVLLLYQGCVRFLNRAQMAIEGKNVEGAHNALIRAQDILRELQSTLNYDAGGALATSLEGIYGYCLLRLVEANMSKTIEPVIEVKRLIGELASAWEEAMRGLRSTGGKPRS